MFQKTQNLRANAVSLLCELLGGEALKSCLTGNKDHSSSRVQGVKKQCNRPSFPDKLEQLVSLYVIFILDPGRL